MFRPNALFLGTSASSGWPCQEKLKGVLTGRNFLTFDDLLFQVTIPYICKYCKYVCIYILYIYIYSIIYIYIYSIFILLILLVYPGIVELSSYFLWGWIRGFSSPVAHLPLSGFPESQPTGKVVQNTQVLNHYYCLNKWCTDLEVTTSFTDPLVVFNRNLTVLYIKWIPQITQELWQSNGGCWGDCKCLRGEDSRFFAGNLPLFHSKVIEGGPLTLLNLTRQREWWLNVTNKQQTCRQVVHIYTYKQNMGASYIYIYTYFVWSGCVKHQITFVLYSVTSDLHWALWASEFLYPGTLSELSTSLGSPCFSWRRERSRKCPHVI